MKGACTSCRQYGNIVYTDYSHKFSLRLCGQCFMKHLETHDGVYDLVLCYKCHDYFITKDEDAILCDDCIKKKNEKKMFQM